MFRSPMRACEGISLRRSAVPRGCARGLGQVQVAPLRTAASRRRPAAMGSLPLLPGRGRTARHRPFRPRPSAPLPETMQRRLPLCSRFRCAWRQGRTACTRTPLSFNSQSSDRLRFSRKALVPLYVPLKRSGARARTEATLMIVPLLRSTKFPAAARASRSGAMTFNSTIICRRSASLSRRVPAAATPALFTSTLIVASVASLPSTASRSSRRVRSARKTSTRRPVPTLMRSATARSRCSSRATRIRS